MRIGITGGTGFLGGLLTVRLLSEGHEVVVFTRSPERARARIPRRAVPAAWDPLTPMPPGHLDSLDAVVTLTGLSAFGVWTPARKLGMVQSRVTAARNLMLGWTRAAAPPKVLVSGSAVGYYGDGGDAELTEAAPNGRGFMADLVRDWEAEARVGLTLGARVVMLRTGIPLHPAGGALRVMLPPFRLGLGAVIGNGRQWFPWIHIEDWLALAAFCLTTEGAHGPLNGTAPNPMTNRAFTKALAGVLGRPAVLHVPAVLLRAAAREPADEMALVSQRVVPARALELGFRFRFPELEEALRDLLG
jgi:uncharacterized protein (TIGR01777 family)